MSAAPPEPSSYEGATQIGWLRLARAIAGAGLVTLFFSEFFFVNEGPALSVLRAPSPVVALRELSGLWAFYAGFALILSAALSAGRTARWEVLVLSGCIFGWGVEGTVIPAVYEALPISLFWTSVSWHMPVDVLLGVIALPWLLRRSWGAAFLGALAVGVVWGAWSTWTWSGGLRLPPDDYALYAARTSGTLILGVLLLGPVLPALWTQPRALRLAVGAGAVFLGVTMGVTSPEGAALLACLAALSVWGLVRFRRAARIPCGTAAAPPPSSAAATADASVGFNAKISASVGTVPAARAVALVATPLSAVPTYTLLFEWNVQPATADTILVLLVLGVCAFLAAIVRAFTMG